MTLGSRCRLSRTDAFFCIDIGALSLGIGRADAEEITVRNLRYPGYLASFEIAEARGRLREKGVTLAVAGCVRGGPESLMAPVGGPIAVGGAATAAAISAIAGAKIIGVSRCGIRRRWRNDLRAAIADPVAQWRSNDRTTTPA